MPDRRSKRGKLEDMARDKGSPNEARVAQRKLAEERLREMGIKPDFDAVPPGGGGPHFAHIPALGGWVGLWSSNHYPDDGDGLDRPVGRKTKMRFEYIPLDEDE